MTKIFVSKTKQSDQKSGFLDVKKGPKNLICKLFIPMPDSFETHFLYFLNQVNNCS